MLYAFRQKITEQRKHHQSSSRLGSDEKNVWEKKAEKTISSERIAIKIIVSGRTSMGEQPMSEVNELDREVESESDWREGEKITK